MWQERNNGKEGRGNDICETDAKRKQQEDFGEMRGHCVWVN